MDEFVDGRTDNQMEKQLNNWTIGWWMDGWTIEGMDNQMNG